MGWTIQPTTLVTFDNVRIPEKYRIGEEGIGFKIAMKALDGGRINIASCSLGGATFCLEAAKKYLQARTQFGKQLSEFQYLQFKFADMAGDLITSRYFPPSIQVGCSQSSLTSGHKRYKQNPLRFRGKESSHRTMFRCV